MPKVSALPAATAVADDDEVNLIQAGVSRRVDRSLLSGVLFKWNELDVSQFDIANAALVGGTAPSVAVETINGFPHVRFRANKTAGGSPLHASVPIFVTLPSRYVIRFRLREPAGTTANWGGLLYQSNGLAGASHDGFTLLGSLAGGQSFTPAHENGVQLTSGTALSFGIWQDTASDTMGRELEVIVSHDLTIASGNLPNTEVRWRRLDGGEGERWDIAARAGSYPLVGASWDPTTLTKAGLALAETGGGTGDFDVAFSEIAIFAHWMDL